MSSPRRRSGMIDQRDRGRKRHRDIGTRAGASSGRHESEAESRRFRAWLPEFLESEAPEFGECESQDLLALSAEHFLQRSGGFGIPPDERLRLLAIELEETRAHASPVARWHVADRMYQEAIRLDPDDGVHQTSRALTAYNMLVNFDDEARDKVLAISLEASIAATLLKPCAHAFGVAGQCRYSVDSEGALACYESALELDPESPWSLLYRAHCLHDLRLWAEAAEAYAAVPKHRFVGKKAWRVDLLREQRADCLRRSGSLELAGTEFELILTRYEREPHLASATDMEYLRQACDDWPEFEPRIAAVEQSERYGL